MFAKLKTYNFPQTYYQIRLTLPFDTSCQQPSGNLYSAGMNLSLVSADKSVAMENLIRHTHFPELGCQDVITGDLLPARFSTPKIWYNCMLYDKL